MTRRFGLVVAALAFSVLALAALGPRTSSASGEFINVTPDSAFLPVGSIHTVTAVPGCTDCGTNNVVFTFFVRSGPNAGKGSPGVGVPSSPCIPANCASSTSGALGAAVKWSYSSDAAGTDFILVCGTFDRAQVTLCDTVEVTWERPPTGAFPIGGAISDQAAENRARAAAAAAPPVVVPPATGTGITISPPNTGDAGLARPTGSATTAYEAAALFAFGIAGLAALKFARR